MIIPFINRMTTIVSIVILMTCSQAIAEPTDGSAIGSSEPLALRRIMQDMGKNMQTITYGIFREDWQLVEQTAPLIADHPQPPLGEKLRILDFVGADVNRYKSYDGRTHDAARTLGEAATRKDGYAVISNFATLQKSCLRCHQSFRKSFQRHFYSKNLQLQPNQ